MLRYSDMYDVGRPTKLVSGSDLGFVSTDNFTFAGTVINDYDGDGQVDLAISAPNADTGSGHVVLVSGATGDELYRIEGPYAYARLGASLLWHDGKLWVGAPGYDQDRGAVFVFENGDTLLDVIGADVYGDDVAGLGKMLAKGPDWAGDASVLLGAPDSVSGQGEDRAGAVFIVLADDAIEVAGVFGQEEFGYFGEAGRSWSGGFLVGAPGEGSQQGTVRYYNSTATYQWTLDGPSPNAAFGSAISTAAQLNEDEYQDFVVGAPGFGAVYLLDISGSNWGEYVWPNGSGFRIGRTVLVVNDMDYDSYPEIAVGTGAMAPLAVVQSGGGPETQMAGFAATTATSSSQRPSRGSLNSRSETNAPMATTLGRLRRVRMARHRAKKRLQLKSVQLPW